MEERGVATKKDVDAHTGGAMTKMRSNTAAELIAQKGSATLCRHSDGSLKHVITTQNEKQQEMGCFDSDCDSYSDDFSFYEEYFYTDGVSMDDHLVELKPAETKGKLTPDTVSTTRHLIVKLAMFPSWTFPSFRNDPERTEEPSAGGDDERYSGDYGARYSRGPTSSSSDDDLALEEESDSDSTASSPPSPTATGDDPSRPGRRRRSRPPRPRDAAAATLIGELDEQKWDWVNHGARSGLTLGKLGGCAVVDVEPGMGGGGWVGLRFMGNVRTDPFLQATTPARIIFPRQRPFQHPPDIRHALHADDRLHRQVNYFRSRHGGEDRIDAPLLTRLLEEEFYEERERHLYDPLEGNPVCGYRVWEKGGGLLMSGGPTGNELYLYPLKRRPRSIISPVQAVPWLEPIHVFRTPIRQVVASLLLPGPKSNNLLAVRTYSNLAFLTTRPCSNSYSPLEAQLIQTIQPASDPVDVCFSPTLACEAAAVCEDGSVLLWNLAAAGREGEPADRVRTEVGPHEVKLEPKALAVGNAAGFRAVEYGAHPRSLWLADAVGLRMADLRAKETPQYRFKAPPLTRLTAIARDASNPFQLAICTTASTLLVDTRAASRPLLEWDAASALEPSIGATFCRLRDHRNVYSFFTHLARV
ncbi:hypothetical protein HK101_005377 [Irineochytrium annulatum]|nr:hypothetical protein HK101_005377 [Irineochytrium annulatum]